MPVEQMTRKTNDREAVHVRTQENATNAAEPSPFNNATRIQESITAAVEGKVLLWLAKRMPAWVHPDVLTLLGFVSTLLASASYALARWNSAGLLVAPFFLALNWFGDSLDGTLARVRDRQRPRYGFYVDHMADSMGALFLMGGLAASHYIRWEIAMGMLVAFLLLSIESYLATYTLGVFRLSFWKFGPSEIRILLAIGGIALWFRPNLKVAGSPFRLLDFGGVIAIGGMAIMLVITAALHTAKLYREEDIY